MPRYIFAVLLLTLGIPAYARDLSGHATACLDRLRLEADFIVSRINLIHRDYEARIKHSGLADFHSGNYSTDKLLNNTIRRYRDRLIRRIRAYPLQYNVRVKSHARSNPGCRAQTLEEHSVGTIHDFERSWEDALRQAKRNAQYFQQLDAMK